MLLKKRNNLLIIIFVILMNPGVFHTQEIVQNEENRFGWTCSEDKRVWIRLIEGEQVGFSILAFYMLENETVRINGLYHRVDISGIHFFDYINNRTIDFYFQGLEGKIIVDESLELESPKKYLQLGVFRVKWDAVVWLTPAVLLGIISGAFTGRTFKRRSEAIK